MFLADWLGEIESRAGSDRKVGNLLFTTNEEIQIMLPIISPGEPNHQLDICYLREETNIQPL